MKNQFIEKFKMIDLFGKSVSLTYKGRETYKTVIGSIFTLIYILVLLGKIIYDMTDVWSGTILSIDEITVYSDTSNFELDKNYL